MCRKTPGGGDIRVSPVRVGKPVLVFYTQGCGYHVGDQSVIGVVRKEHPGIEDSKTFDYLMSLLFYSAP